MAAGFKHGACADVVEIRFKIPSLFKNGIPFYFREAINKNTKRFTTGMHVDGFNFEPVFRWLPCDRFVYHGEMLIELIVVFVILEMLEIINIFC